MMILNHGIKFLEAHKIIDLSVSVNVIIKKDFLNQYLWHFDCSILLAIHDVHHGQQQYFVFNLIQFN